MRILIAEDNADALASLATLLELKGHEVRCAPDGEAAIEAARDFRPEVAILDIGMPLLGGYALARRLRAEPWGRDMLLIAHTAWGSEENKERALEAGFDHHVTKPVPVDVLHRLLEQKR